MLELDDKVERVVTAAGALWVAVWNVRELLETDEVWDLIPLEQRRHYRDAINEAAGAYGKLRAAQQELEGART